MPELGTSGSVRGVCSNAHPYRDKDAPLRCCSFFGVSDNFLTVAKAGVQASPPVHARGGLWLEQGATAEVWVWIPAFAAVRISCGQLIHHSRFRVRFRGNDE